MIGVYWKESVKSFKDLDGVEIDQPLVGVFVQDENTAYVCPKQLNRWIDLESYSAALYRSTQHRSTQYRHNKTGRIYTVESFNIVNGTNAQDGQTMTLYSRDGRQFVRETEEFLEKFTKVEYNVDSKLHSIGVPVDDSTMAAEVSTHDS